MVEICVVNCCSCETFQGQQVKKGKKWICKMCGEKQSFRKIFAQGSGKECRQVVQKLNMISGNLKRQMLEEAVCLQEHNNETTGSDVQGNEEKCSTNQTSKWNQFISSATSDATEIEQLDENSAEFTTERETFKKHRAQKRKKPMKEITSDNLNEYQQRKTQKFDHSKRTYHSKTGQSHLGDLEDEVKDVSSPGFSASQTENERRCTIKKSSQRQTQTCPSTEAAGPIKFSKWSKYT